MTTTILRKFCNFCICLFLCVAIDSCRQDVPAGVLPQGYVAMTFDDASINNWYDHLTLLDSLQIHATFYICKYHTLSPEQKQKLHVIAAHGHEIAYHTTNHPDMKTMLEHEGMNSVINEEIVKDLTLMRLDGYNVKNFAYPFGKHTVELDAELLKIFNSVRALANKNNYGKALALQSCRKQVFYSPDLDDSRGNWPDDDLVNKLMGMASDKKACAVFVAHEIDNPNYRYSISADRLKRLALMAQRNNLRFITVNQISE